MICSKPIFCRLLTGAYFLMYHQCFMIISNIKRLTMIFVSKDWRYPDFEIIMVCFAWQSKAPTCGTTSLILCLVLQSKNVSKSMLWNITSVLIPISKYIIHIRYIIHIGSCLYFPWNQAFSPRVPSARYMMFHAWLPARWAYASLVTFSKILWYNAYYFCSFLFKISFICF